MRADPSTRLLSEVARHVIIPEGIVDSVWYEVEERCREWGDQFDKWQDGLGQLTLGLRADGKYACTVGGVTFSIPRQVAKTFIVGRMVFALSTIFPETTALWTAHRSQTASMTFQKLAAYARKPAVQPYLAVNRSDGLRSTNGQQEIEFRNGSRILFGAREQGFGRGFDEVDIEVFDEAQILTEKALEDMVPAANQSRNPHGGLLIFMGTPPRPVDPGDAFKARRRKALAIAGDSADVVAVGGNSLYIETSADPNVGKPGGPKLDDKHQIAKANPSYPHRTPQESIDRMRENLPSDDAWLREALGRWDDESEGSRLISAALWSRCGVESAPEGIPSYGVAFSQDGSRVSLAGCRKHSSGFHVELIDAQSGPVELGIGALADWLAGCWRDSAVIVISGAAGANVLQQALRDRGVPQRLITVATTPNYTTACAMTWEAVKDGTLSHLDSDGQSVLDESVAVCDMKKRNAAGAWGWEATTPDGDETPMESISLALFGSRTSKRVPGRKAELL
ncbi:terminase [Rathayibacter sp. AY1B8]|uniref:terminase n=1 Tax=Rathayibacter sp. AY1B8 TaxID=2080533 RepID=UPI000CE81E0B|nr:terminase [Rathayibacter sp. AY1B8]PPI08224.1 terminase [Rathayibacter sp. AY1B8]